REGRLRAELAEPAQRGAGRVDVGQGADGRAPALANVRREARAVTAARVAPDRPVLGAERGQVHVPTARREAAGERPARDLGAVRERRRVARAGVGRRGGDPLASRQSPVAGRPGRLAVRADRDLGEREIRLAGEVLAEPARAVLEDFDEDGVARGARDRTPGRVRAGGAHDRRGLVAIRVVLEEEPVRVVRVDRVRDDPVPDRLDRCPVDQHAVARGVLDGIPRPDLAPGRVKHVEAPVASTSVWLRATCVPAVPLMSTAAPDWAAIVFRSAAPMWKSPPGPTVEPITFPPPAPPTKTPSVAGQYCPAAGPRPMRDPCTRFPDAPTPLITICAGSIGDPADPFAPRTSPMTLLPELPRMPMPPSAFGAEPVPAASIPM